MKSRTCSVEGCGKEHNARGWCLSHYQRWRRNGTPDDQRPKRATCLVSGCSRRVIIRALRLCSKHYRLLQIYGTTDEEEIKTNRCVKRFWSKVDVSNPDGCWLWAGVTSLNGYGRFWDGKRQVGAHQYAYLIQRGPIPSGMLVCHKCDVPACVRGDHLFIGTHHDNMVDMAAKGRASKGNHGHNLWGEAHQNHTISSARVREMRERNASGERTASIARDMQLNYDVVRSIVTGRRRKRG